MTITRRAFAPSPRRPRGALLLLAMSVMLAACGEPEPGIDGGRLDAALDAQAESDAQVDAAIADGGSAPVDVWAPLAHLAVVDPTDHGAVVDDESDDGDALEAAVDALPLEGGIVRFGAGRFLKDRRLWTIERSHVLLWAPNGRATLLGTVTPGASGCGAREQATIFEGTVGGGVFGLHLTSNATTRTSCGEDNQIVLDSTTATEIVGVEIEGSSATGLFAWASRADAPPTRDLFVEGNYVHHTYADSIHQTSGTRGSHVWGNWIFNEAPSEGDDGVACVTYGVDSPRCGDMEWWDNRYVGGGHGRGLAVIGGEDIFIHHNWIIGASAAGVIVASEGGYDSASAERIRIESNWIVRSPDGSVDNGHSSILVSGGNGDAPPLRDVTSVDNVILEAPDGRVERAEGRYDAATVTFANLTDPARLPSAPPTEADARPRDTTILRTRDTSFVASEERAGLYRIHVRERPDDGALEERFEYVVRGAPAAIETWTMALSRSHVASSRTVDGVAYVAVLVAAPVVLPSGIEAVTFDDLRAGDLDGSLSWLWSDLDGPAL